ncbi:MAG: transposase [Candidatus Paceibacterota bacterium]
MSIRKINFVDGEYYHIYNRGNSRQKIFIDKNDYFHFMGLLFACNSTSNLKTENLTRKNGLTIYDFDRGDSLVDIGTYCLMPNHFHILITKKSEGGISKFMQKLSTAYSMYFNKKYKRSGSLFEGKFKSEHANDDRYLKYLFSYIHLNPIKLIQHEWKESGVKDKEEALNYLKKYFYSSCIDFLGENRIQNKIINHESFPKYFPSKNLFKKEIFEWISYNKK